MKHRLKRQQKGSIKLRALKKNVDKTDKHVDRFTKKKRRLKIRKERGGVTTDTTEIQRSLRNYVEQEQIGTTLKKW